ncbi:MAG: nitronate monooxygenase [Alphaproteobacteria bacterium]|nr:nitronate monooxygenase [Alphaproteobacteria bacterium]
MTAEAGKKAWAAIRPRLKLPVLVAPMFLVSGTELVIASCRAGVIGAFPTVNARTAEELERWLATITSALADDSKAAPFAANLVVHRSNKRLAEDVALVAKYRVPIVATAIGSPSDTIGAVHAYGGMVLADVASVRHAERAVAAGVDGLVLLCAGAGGNTGWLSPFAFVAAVREFFDGPIAVAGGIADGRAIRAVEVLGADLVYMGTRFIAASESLAEPDYRDMLARSGPDDILLTEAVTGIPANFLGESLRRAGFSTEGGRAAKSFDLEHETATLRAWKTIWSAGHSVAGVTKAAPVADLVADLAADYAAAKRA